MDARILHRCRPGFSLIELVIVVVIIGIIGAIAIPRMSDFVNRAEDNRLIADLQRMQSSADRYEAEHVGETIGDGGVGVITLKNRLTKNTDLNGTVNASGIFGPYLRAFPPNSLNNKSSVRINGAAAGAGTHGWRYHTASGLIQSDHTRGTATKTKIDDTMSRIDDRVIAMGG